jgi:hypothetical protein
MPNYNNGKIYKIVCNTTGEIYIGSTVMQLCRRLSTHVNDAKRLLNSCKSNDIILRKNYSIVLIENCPCNNKEELQRKEREHIEANICVNKVIPQQTQKEWRDKNRDKLAIIDKRYKDKNKDKVNDRRKIYYALNAEKIKDNRKIYYEKNINYIKERNKEYSQLYRNTKLIRQLPFWGDVDEIATD